MKSMTGFGLARGKVGPREILVEARSVNHRFCEVSLRFPARFARVESEVVRHVRQLFSRGKFDLFLREEARDKATEEIALARKTHQLLKRIQKELSLKADIALSDLLTFRGILFSHSSDEDSEAEKFQRPLIKLVDQALTGLRRMREREGKSLQKWFEKELQQLLRLLASIERHSHRRRTDYRRRLEGKLKGMGTVDGERLHQEAAIMAERADVTEEIVRLRSHLNEFRRFLHQKEPIGRKFDFLAQEMGREINTIGSKAQGVRLAHEVIEFKAELERIREQIQNVE